MPRATSSKRRRTQPSETTESMVPALALTPPQPTDVIIHDTEASTSTPQPPSATRSIKTEIMEEASTFQLPIAVDTITASSDLDLAFELQMKEAIAASVLFSTSTADEFVAAPDVFAEGNDEGNIHHLKSEVRSMREDFDLRLHDRKVASEIIAIPDDEWIVTGDNYARPYAIGSTSATGGSDLGFCQQFSLYFKGLVVEDKKKNAKLGAIGVAIFDSTNAVVLEVSKPLDLPKAEMTDDIAELEAFVQGLELAFTLELTNVVYFCVDFDVDHYLTANPQPNNTKAAELVCGAVHLKNRFQRCHSSAVMQNNAEFVSGLARSSIEKQAGKAIKEIIVIKETCPICLEDIESEGLFEFGNCHHCYCYSCLQKHVELKVRERELPRCPLSNCELELNINDCRKFLTRKMYHVLDQFMKESSIPVSEKLYCPNPRCSNLMSKTEELAKSLQGGTTACTCVNCHTKFCINCKVLWHLNMSCDNYLKQKPDLNSPDGKLKLLAGDEKWRQCPMCYHMVELVIGCNHIYCRCGHQFCYLCGSEWKNKKATCSCPLWSEDKIILGGGANLQ